MSYNLIIKGEAHQDTIVAYDYYESRQSGLGERFLEALMARYADMTEHPQYYSYIAEDPQHVLRDVKLENFPFVVVYEITSEDEVVIYAFHNTYREPSGKLRK